LKRNDIKCRDEPRKTELYAYGSKEPLKTAGVFWSTIVYKGVAVDDAEFVVIEGSGQSLLSCDTAMRLGVLKIVRQTETPEIPDVVNNYNELFTGLGKLEGYQLEVPIDQAVKPVVQPTRRVPYQLREKLEAKIKELLDSDVIEPVSGPSKWVSPVVIIPKNDGDIRLCVDMRQANRAIQRTRYPIPTVDEVLQEMNNSKYFSKLDIKNAYHQIELSPESREITTFTTHSGLYRYKRLMFGITCAPEMYQMILQQTLQGCEGVNSIADDIIVHTATKEQHDTCLNKVLCLLRDKGFTLNKEKCQFYMNKLVFMGHELSERGIGATQVKVDAVVNAPEPRNASEVRSFLGLVNFCARFIPNLSTISAPLNDLLRKNTVFKWGRSQQDAFKELKRRLACAETLGYYDKTAPTKVIVDASPVGLGAVLVQIQNGENRVISYASRSLTDVERRYSQTEKEGLSVVWALERFHPWLYGIEFELLTDHKPLEYIYGPRSKPCARLERWVLRLQPYRFTVKHVNGRDNIADALSRLPLKHSSRTIDSVDDHEYIKFVAREATPSAMTTREIEEVSFRDAEISRLRESVTNGTWDKHEQSQFIHIKDELCVIGYLVLRGTRIVVPRELRKRVLDLGHIGHPGIVLMKSNLRTKVWWPGIDKEIENYCKTCYGCQLVSQSTNPEPMTRTELPSAPWQDLAADVLGPLPSGDYIFVCVDYYSRYVELEVTKVITSEKLVSILRKWFLTHGLPLSLRTDNASSFVCEHFENYLQSQGIEHRRNTPLWPQANGEVERQNRSILKRLRISQSQNRNWRLDLDDYLIMYRSTPHSVTGMSPAEMLFGRKIRTCVPEINTYRREDSEIRDRDSEKKGKGKVYSDAKRNAKESEIVPGDKVLLKQNRNNKLDTPFSSDKYTVIDKNGNSVVVRADDGTEYRRNVTHMKKMNEQNPQTDSNVNNSKSEHCQINVSSAGKDRPIRVRKMPEKFNDFKLV